MALDGVFAVLPLLLIICVGYAIANQPWFGRPGLNFLSKFNIGVAIPIFMISNVTRMYKDPRELIGLAANLPYAVLIPCVALAVAVVMTRIMGIRPPQRGVFVNVVGLSNTVVMGMPVVVSLFGPTVLPTLMVYYASNTIVYWTLGVWLLRREATGRTATGIGGSLKEALTTPPLLGFIIGMLWVIIGIPVPEFLDKTFASFSNCVTALAMVFIGSVIRFSDFSNIGKHRSLMLLLGYKYFLTPVIAGFVCWMLPVPPLMKQVFFILSNMPAMAQLPIMAKEVGSDYEMASLSTAVTTTISMATVPLYILLMDYTGIFA